MSDDAIRILIVDDHEMVRRGLISFLGTFEDLKVIGEASNGAKALEKIEGLQAEVDVIVMDLIMPEMDGFQAIRVIHERYPEIAVIALSSAGDSNAVTAAMQAGATSYLLKNIRTEHLADAIRAARRGEHTFSPEATQALIRAATRPPQPHIDLTEREMDVLKLMTMGLNNPEIAERLMISRSTVKYHISAILAKLGVSNRSEAIAMALKQKLI